MTCPLPGKRKYSSELEAAREAKRVASQLKAYHCSCGAWHLERRR